METETYILPAYWASYLINGDATGLEDDEQQECDDFLATIPGRWAIDAEDLGFRWFNDANNLGGDVAEFTFAL